MIVADAARITAAAWILIVVIVSARPMLLGDALTLSFDNIKRHLRIFLTALGTHANLKHDRTCDILSQTGCENRKIESADSFLCLFYIHIVSASQG